MFSCVCRFFEWHREKGQRQPYFIYFTDHAPTEEMVEVSTESAEGGREVGREVGKEGGEEGEKDGKKGGEVEKGNVWEHPTGRMLTMAGLFDIWKSEDGVSYDVTQLLMYS